MTCKVKRRTAKSVCCNMHRSTTAGLRPEESNQRNERRRISKRDACVLASCARQQSSAHKPNERAQRTCANQQQHVTRVAYTVPCVTKCVGRPCISSTLCLPLGPVLCTAVPSPPLASLRVAHQPPSIDLQCKLPRVLATTELQRHGRGRGPRPSKGRGRGDKCNGEGGQGTTEG